MNVNNMYCTRYKTLDEFKASVLSDLLENELENSFMIGAMHKLPKETEDYVMVATHNRKNINKDGKPKATFVCFQGGKPFPMILATTVDDYLPSLQNCFDFLMEEQILEDSDSWMGPTPFISDFMNLISKHVHPVYLFRKTKHYCLDHVDQDVICLVDKEVSEGSSFGEITAEDEWVLLWGKEFCNDIGELDIPTERIKAAQSKMIENHDMWKWQIKVNGAFVPVAMTAKHRETPHIASIASVYTPPEHRGKGYATRCVASVCQHLLTNRGKHYVTLFADEENPISNRVYIKLGFNRFQDVEHYKRKSDNKT